MTESGRNPIRNGTPTPRDRAWALYVADCARWLPELHAQGYVLHVADEDRRLDEQLIRTATQIGLALLRGVPLVVFRPRGVTLSPGMERAAAIVIDDVDVLGPDDEQRIVDALRAVIESE
jgi:hypothetical protein